MGIKLKLKTNIQTKMLLIFGLILGMLVIVGIIGLNSANSIHEMLTTMYNNQATGISEVKQANVELYRIRYATMRAILADDPDEVDTYEADVQAAEQSLKDEMADFDTLILTEDGVARYEAVMETLDNYMPYVYQVMDLSKKNLDARSMEVVADGAPLAEEITAGMEWMAEQKDLQAKEYNDQSAVTAQQAQTTIIIAIALATVAGFALAFFFSRSISKVARLMASKAEEIANVDLTNLVAVTGAMADGDLTQSIRFQASELTYHSSDELGQLADAFNNMIMQLQDAGAAFAIMVDKFHSALYQVADSAAALSASSQQLAQSSEQSANASSQIALTIQQITQGTGSQTESVNRTMASVEQMNRAITSVADGAQEQAAAVDKASQLTMEINSAIEHVAQSAESGARGANNATQVAKGSAAKVTRTIEGMGSIRQKVALSVEKVKEMGSRSEQVGMIVETIDDIASQTNLLALNAAIEAARAGEHGKGFAVVAEEVRKLAERSSLATKEISTLIHSIQVTVGEAVAAMDKSAGEVETGVASANEAGQALNEILQTIEGFAGQVSQIATASKEIDGLSNELVDAMNSVSAVVEENTAATEQMSAGANEVHEAVENIASVSEENSAATEEVSASAEEMSAQVEEVTSSAQSLAEMATILQNMVAQFKLTAEK
ncbi:MAG: HAMP domain-containing protein [Chloroflexi bacterium]|nr:methyl-accepting chemotaxis protein [Anaerolineaceae bacterium]NMB88459.1 HAMP domain-containing protein [Chloroflexota bacterium]